MAHDTQRLRLRQWCQQDLEPFAALNADPAVMEFFPSTLERQTSDAFAAHCQGRIDERGWGLWAVELKRGGEFIGFVGLEVPNYELPFSPCTEIGWRLARRFWGAGYATEAARAALRVAFEDLALEELVSFTSLLNARSIAVMRRLGMHDSGETFQHPAVAQGSPLREHCLYRLRREAWSGLPWFSC